MPHEDPVLRVLCEGHPPWAQVAILAGRQARAISNAQLRDCGITRRAIEGATARHHLHVVHRGVRAVGTKRLSTEGRRWAALLAVGRDCAFSDLTGGAVLGIRPWSGCVHLAAPTNRRDHRDVVVHHVAALAPSMVVTRSGLPVLRAEHVLLDLAARLAADALAIALNEALARRLTTLARVDAAIRLRCGHHGCGRLARALTAARDDPGRGGTHGELEALVLPKFRALPGLPPYDRNQIVELGGGRLAKADMLFRGLGVMVELDSRTWHAQRLAMDSDRRRDQQALAVGVVTFRITWRHAISEWDAVTADLLALLRRQGG